MGRTSLKERVQQGVFLLDGAMGTQLFARGVEAGKCNDYLNIGSPDIVFDIHRAYLEAGSDAVLTNTFGANKYALARHGLNAKVEEINTAGAEIARRAADEEKYVLGDIGPSGDFLKPLGNLNPAECKEAFTEQAKALVAGGVDGLIIETMTALDETAIAVEAVKSVCGDLPVFASMAFDRAGKDFRTMMGVDVESAVAKMASIGACAVGFNCGTTTLEEYIELAKKFVSAVKSLGKDILVYAEPNAGKPELVENKAVYNVSPEDFAAAIEQIRKAGVTIIGGCCGTTPAHIRALSEGLKK
jgi:methionine synthase I (cobalamin-dependent)